MTPSLDYRAGWVARERQCDEAMAGLRAELVDLEARCRRAEDRADEAERALARLRRK